MMICAEEVKNSTNGQPIRDTPDAASLWYLYSRSFASSLNDKVKNFVCLFRSLKKFKCNTTFNTSNLDYIETMVEYQIINIITVFPFSV